VSVEPPRRDAPQRQLPEVRIDHSRDETAVLAQGGRGELAFDVVEPLRQ
jgi:hypothetical protein